MIGDDEDLWDSLLLVTVSRFANHRVEREVVYNVLYHTVWRIEFEY
jgi:hypothetical protein